MNGKHFRWLKLRFLPALLSITLLTACSDEDEELTPLATPTSLSVSSSAATSLSFSWSSVTNAVEYYCVLSRNGAIAAEQCVTEPAVTFTGLTHSTTYTLRVTAYAAIGSSSYVESSPVELEGTTATPAPLPDISNVAVEGDGSSLTYTWDAVANAASYDYTFTKDGETVEEGNATELTLSFTGLTPGVYVFTLVAKPDNDAYLDSNPNVTSFTIEAVENEPVTGEWAASDGIIDFSHKSAITACDDGSYVISDWCGVQGYDLKFKPDGAGFTVLNSNSESGGYANMWNGTEYLQIYVGAGYTYFDGDASAGQIAFYLYLADGSCDYVYFTWEAGTQDQTEFTGTMYLNTSVDDDGNPETFDSQFTTTLVKNDDGSYTLRNPYTGVSAVTFTLNEGGGVTITNAGRESGMYKYFYVYPDPDDTENYHSVVYYDGDTYSYAEVMEDSIYIYMYRYDYSISAGGYDYFIWEKE